MRDTGWLVGSWLVSGWLAGWFLRIGETETCKYDTCACQGFWEERLEVVKSENTGSRGCHCARATPEGKCLAIATFEPA